MTIGQRIRYCRKARNMTQDQLAAACGIHPVSIRKYETDKMQPLPEQVQRIADALSVSYFALVGIDSIKINAWQNEDVTSLIMLMINAGIIQLNCPVLPHGDKDFGKSSYRLNHDSFSRVKVRNRKTGEICALDDIEFFQDNAFPSFPLFDWQEKKRQYEQQVAAAGSEPDEETLKALTDSEEELERYQLNLQTEEPILVGEDLAYQQYLDALRTYEAIGEELGMPRPVEPVFTKARQPAERRTKIVDGKEYVIPSWITHPEDWDPTTDFSARYPTIE